MGSTLQFLGRYVYYNPFVRRFLQTGSSYRVVVNSVPKSGTHLVMKALELAPGLRRAPIQFGRQRIGLLPWVMVTCPEVRHVILSQYHAQNHDLEPHGLNRIPIDSDSPFFLTEEDTAQIIRLIRPGWFAMGHLPYSEALGQIVNEEQVKMIVVLRDPRDVAVSHANYLARKTSHYMNPLYKTLSPKERLMISITGTPPSSRHPRLLNIRERYEGILAWTSFKKAYATCFERLIGPQGAGSRHVQLEELRAIMEHLEVSISETELFRIAENMFGGTRTFSEGKRGRWQKEFDNEHRSVCKDLVGDLLIELGYEQDLNW